MDQVGDLTFGREVDFRSMLSFIFWIAVDTKYFLQIATFPEMGSTDCLIFIFCKPILEIILQAHVGKY